MASFSGQAYDNSSYLRAKEAQDLYLLWRYASHGSTGLPHALLLMSNPLNQRFTLTHGHIHTCSSFETQFAMLTVPRHLFFVGLVVSFSVF